MRYVECVASSHAVSRFEQNLLEAVPSSLLLPVHHPVPTIPLPHEPILKVNALQTHGPPNTVQNLRGVKNHLYTLVSSSFRLLVMQLDSLVLASKVPLLEQLLDRLLGILTVSGLLEGLGGDGSLEALKLECVTGGEEVVVVDGLRGYWLARVLGSENCEGRRFRQHLPVVRGRLSSTAPSCTSYLPGVHPHPTSRSLRSFLPRTPPRMCGTLAHLDERLDLGSLLHPLLAHSTGDLPWVSLDTGNDGVGVRSLLRIASLISSVPSHSNAQSDPPWFPRQTGE
jgi:hypothetical protein